jgi:formate-dependent nitrite reductase membrane component NrfD
MWSEQQEGAGLVTSGNPHFNNSSAAALLSYDIAHSIPWDWRVSLYTWTKGIASGVYLVACLLVLLGYIDVNNSLWLWATPVISGAFLAITGGLLLWDLEHPKRFYLIFTRPQWRSWLVKGAFIIAGYTLILLLHFIASWTGWRSFQTRLMIAGIPLSILTAVYTAYLFAQAKARDMWQNPLLPPHLFFQAVLLGSAVLLPLVVVLTGASDLDRFLGFRQAEVNWLLWVLAISSLIHLLMVWGEVSLTHPTAHSRLAIWEMVKGRYKNEFWMGTILSTLGALLPLLAALEILSESIGIAGAPLALVGLMLFESAYVQAGQSVPLA